jgi:hypothetical protein
MPPNDARIRHLSPDVAKQIRSSVSLTHLNEVVVELVKNSLDAGAQLISVTVDYLRGGCVVQDDGYGIPADAFEDGAGLGLPHRAYSIPWLQDALTDNRYFKVQSPRTYSWISRVLPSIFSGFIITHNNISTCSRWHLK